MIHSNSTFGRSLFSGAILALIMLMTACAGGTRTGGDPGASASIERSPAPALPSRIYAFEGEALVIPVDSPEMIGAPVRTEDGRTLPTSLHRVRRVPVAHEPGAWLSPTDAWSAETIPLVGADVDTTDAGRSRGELWMVRVELPEGYTNRPLYAGDRRLPVIWVPTPPPTTDSRFVRGLTADASSWRELGGMLATLRRDPVRRWRVRLLTDRVRPARLWGAGASDEIELGSPVLETLARQTELRYRAAIARIQLDSPELSADVLAAMTRIVSTTEGRLLPAWSDATERVRTMVDTALNTTRPAARAAEAARGWLDSIPPIRPWVIDDGSRMIEGARVATIGLTNLSNGPVRVSASARGKSSGARVTIDAHRSSSVRSPIVVDPPRIPTEPPSARPMIVRAGEPLARLGILTPGRDFDPPGLRIGPFFRMSTRRSWLAGRPIPSPRSNRTSALLQQSPEGDGWELYIECEAPGTVGEGEALESDDRVRVWLGPYGGSEGYILTGPGAASRLRGTSPPPYRAHTWGWSSVVQIPDGLIAPDGTIDLALERLDGRGTRSTWPRPMMPAQREPGRATVRLVPWDAFTDRGAGEPSADRLTPLR